MFRTCLLLLLTALLFVSCSGIEPESTVTPLPMVTP